MKIKYKIPIIFITIIMLVIISVFTITTIFSALTLLEIERQAYEETVASTSNMIALSIEGELEHLQSIACEEAVIEAVEYRHENPSAPYSSNEYTNVNNFLESITSINSYTTGIYLADTNGTIFASSTPNLYGVNIMDRTYYNEAMKGNVYVSEVITSKDSGKLEFVLSCPVSSNGQVLGVICKSVDLQMIFDIVDELELGETGYAYIVDSNNNIIHHPNGDYVGTVDDDQQHDSICDGDIIIDNDDGKLKYCLALPMETLNLTIVFSTELEEIVEPIRIQFFSSLVVVAIVLLMGVFAIVILSRKATKPLNQLVDTVNAAKKDLSVRSNIVSKDEIGVLSNEINSMFQAIELKNEEIEKLVFYNNVTKLPNNLKLKKDFEAFLASDEEKYGTMVTINIKNFRSINENYGRIVGDNVLKTVGKVLSRLEKGNSKLYHIASDEFMFLSKQNDSKEYSLRRWDDLNKLFEKPFWVRSKEIYISFNVVATIFDSCSADFEKLQYSNDLAMRYGKERGDGIVFFSESFSEQALRTEQVKGAIAKGILFDEGFYIEYQPQIEIKSMNVVGVETLVRYQDSNIGLVLPSEFIPIAEESKQLVPLGEKIIRDTFKFIENWNKKELGSIRFAINVSASQLADDSFASYVKSAFSQFDVSPKNIELEIPESMMIDIMKKADYGGSKVLSTLESFREYGIKIVIDNLGVGYSSLYYLSNLPVDVVKIDKSFIDDITSSASSKSLVENIIKMSHNLGIKTVAKGVESGAQLLILEELGCDIVQGYYFSKPLSEEVIKDFVNKGL